MKINAFTHHVGGKCFTQFVCADILYFDFPKFNKVAKVLATCLWYCQKRLLSLTSLWTKNSGHLTKPTPKMQVQA